MNVVCAVPSNTGAKKGYVLGHNITWRNSKLTVLFREHRFTALHSMHAPRSPVFQADPLPPLQRPRPARLLLARPLLARLLLARLLPARLLPARPLPALPLLARPLLAHPVLAHPVRQRRLRQHPLRQPPPPRPQEKLLQVKHAFFMISLDVWAVAGMCRTLGP